MSLDYYKTKRGVVAKLYNHQKENSIARGYSPPAYTLDELYDWCMSKHVFHDLYDLWVISGFDSWQKPSIDRDDDYKSYEFGNISIMTWRENNDKCHADRKSGKNNKMSKAVQQLTKDGVPIKDHYSMSQAERETGVDVRHIQRVCKGKRKTAGGYRWRYI